jgi:TPR repeat protein
MHMRGKLEDCRSVSHDTFRSGMPSPRVAHFDGEVPPALSPLDAFAAQGRFLARQLDESRRGDRRMSRLPPSSVARSLSQGRPNFYRSKSSADSESRPQFSHQPTELTRQPTQKGLPELEEPKYRPVSEHPRFSSVSTASTEASFYDDDDDDDNTTPRTTMVGDSRESYGIPRSQSPEDAVSLSSGAQPPVGVALTEPRGSSTDSSTSRLHIPRTLAPPVSPRSRPSSSAKTTNAESSDDDYSSSNGGSTFSKPRKLSSGSAVSLPYSPMSNFPARPHPRSPSMSSETSATGAHHLPRPSFNFSRPLSRSSTSLSAPGASTPTESSMTPLSNQMQRRSKPTPLILPLSTEEAAACQPNEGDPSSAVSSYTYASYALPRGRFLSRDSIVFAGLQTPHFEWAEPLFEKTPPRHSEEPQRTARTPSPTPRRGVQHSPKPHSMHEVPASHPAPTPQSPPPTQLPQPQTPKSEKALKPPPIPSTPTPSDPALRRSAESARQEKDETVSSADSASTVRPQTATAPVTASGLTADDHVAKGIECHERGSLSESTYHLRVAAKQDHPTGMLLYALACRHGWGMRSNEKEGVRWLRKAVDSVGLEMLANPDAPGASKAKELQKAYRAQFALSIYELGVSYLNGWGIEQDKSLALRCFEIAGQWGDVDAMAEAGFCYAEGVGCKKDMKKAARFYRQAESKGMSMVGNSWYVSFCCFVGAFY